MGVRRKCECTGQSNINGIKNAVIWRGRSEVGVKVGSPFSLNEVVKQGFPKRLVLASFFPFAERGLRRGIEDPLLGFLSAHQQADRH